MRPDLADQRKALRVLDGLNSEIHIQVVPDFLPRPEALVFRDERVKVTIALSKRSVEFFKAEAHKHKTPYQRVIRRLLDAYAEHHAHPRRNRAGRTRAKAARVG